MKETIPGKNSEAGTEKATYSGKALRDISQNNGQGAWLMRHPGRRKKHVPEKNSIETLDEGSI